MTFQEVFVNVWPKNSQGEFEEVCDIHFHGDNQEDEAFMIFNRLVEVFFSLTEIGAINASQVHIVWQHRDGSESDPDEETVNTIEMDDEWVWMPEV